MGKKGSHQTKHLRKSKKGKIFSAGRKAYLDKKMREYEPQLDKDLSVFEERMRNANVFVEEKEIKNLKKHLLKTGRQNRMAKENQREIPY